VNAREYVIAGITMMRAPWKYPNRREYNWGGTALMLAAQKGHKEVVKLLLKKGANVNAKNDLGWTALDFAAKEGYKEIVKLLKAYGAKE